MTKPRANIDSSQVRRALPFVAFIEVEYEAVIVEREVKIIKSSSES